MLLVALWRCRTRARRAHDLHQQVMPSVSLACCILHLFDQPTDLHPPLGAAAAVAPRPAFRHVKQTTSACQADHIRRCWLPDAPHLPSQLLRSDEGAEYSAMDATADGNTAYLADKDGAVEVVDTRQAADAKPAAVSFSQTATKCTELVLSANC